MSSMFEKIKNKLAEDRKGSGFGDILKINETGKTFVVRLLPYEPAPENTFYHYYTHGWVSKATGQYVQAVSPTTVDERDPIAEFRFKFWATASEDEKEEFKKTGPRRSEKWLVNAYVIDDPSNPENNGKVKIIRYGKQLQEIIEEAIDGDDADEFGENIFNLGDGGVDFHIRCEDKGGFPSYTKSKFKTGKDLNLDEDEIKTILESVHDLTTVYTIKSYDELKEMLNEHWHLTDLDDDDDGDDNGVNNNKEEVIKKVESKETKDHTVTTVTDEFDLDDEELQAALDGLD